MRHLVNGTWRDSARSIIVRILEENKGKDEEVVKKALFDACPFGQRQNHPYKIWLDEIKVQRGKRKFGIKNKVTPKEQLDLFK